MDRNTIEYAFTPTTPRPMHIAIRSVQPIHLLLAILIGLALLWGYYVINHEESLDAGLTEFFAAEGSVVPDHLNAAVALEGLSAPKGSDPIAYGRANIAGTASISPEAALTKNGASPLLPTIKGNELDCWFRPPVSCPDAGRTAENRLIELLTQNAELLQRYHSAIRLPAFKRPIVGSQGKNLILLNSLIGARILLTAKRGNHERAYEEWRDNYAFIARTIGADASLVDTAILMVVDGIALDTLAELINWAPHLAVTHRNELLKLLAPSTPERWNPHGIMRAEYRLYSTTMEGPLPVGLHSNFVRNRLYRFAKDVVASSTAPSDQLAQKQHTLWERHATLRIFSLDFLLAPVSAWYTKQLLEGLKKTADVLDNTLQHEARVRALSLAIDMIHDRTSDHNIPEFLLGAAFELTSPFSGQPMQWDATSRRILACRLEKPSNCVTVQVPRLTD